MRKIWSFIVLLTLLTACSNDFEQSSQAERSSADIAYFQQLPHTDEANTIVKSLGADYSMLFSLHLNRKKAKHVNYWIDHYSDGVWKGTILKSEASLKPDGINSTNLYLTLIKLKGNEMIWNMSLLQDLSYSGTKVQTKFQEKAIMFVSPAQELLLPIGDTGELGVFILSDGEGEFDTTDIDQAIKVNEEVYVLRCKIT